VEADLPEPLRRRRRNSSTTVAANLAGTPVAAVGRRPPWYPSWGRPGYWPACGSVGRLRREVERLRLRSRRLTRRAPGA